MMQTNSKLQFSLREMFLGMMLLSGLGTYLMSALRFGGSEILYPFYFLGSIVLLMVAAITGAGNVEKESSRRGTILVVFATVFAVVNGSLLLSNNWLPRELVSTRNLIGIFGALAAISALSCLGVIYYARVAKPRPALLSLILHLIIMASLTLYNAFVMHLIGRSS